VEEREVSCIYGISSIAVTGHQKPFFPLFEKSGLMSRGVCPQHMIVVNIVCVSRRATNMVARDEQRVKILLNRYLRHEVIKLQKKTKEEEKEEGRERRKREKKKEKEEGRERRRKIRTRF
tara:strand:- start:683 stop:1042 length:360 start_codon:yes stop_codon:yes gene_type:complete